MRVAPSILSADYARLAEEVESVRAEADALHVDVMDAHFVPNLTIGPPVVRWIRKHTDLYLDCHLMMDDPGRYLRAFREAGADGCSVHVEVGKTGDLIAQMRELGLGTGLAVNPETPLDDALPWLADIDLLLVMTVHPGFGGQSFMDEVVEKIAYARRVIDERGLAVELEVDGGIDPGTAPVVARAGARLLVAGSAIFGEPDRAEAARRIREAATSVLELGSTGVESTGVGNSARPGSSSGAKNSARPGSSSGARNSRGAGSSSGARNAGAKDVGGVGKERGRGGRR